MLDWYVQTVGRDSVNAVSGRAQLPQATLNRQVANAAISAENVVAIARAYQVSVLDGLIAQGLISAADVATTHTLDALHDATDAQLVAEIARRLDIEGEERHPRFTSSHVPDAADDDNVTPLHARDDIPYAASNDETHNDIDPDTV